MTKEQLKAWEIDPQTWERWEKEFNDLIERWEIEPEELERIEKENAQLIARWNQYDLFPGGKTTIPKPPF